MDTARQKKGEEFATENQNGESACRQGSAIPPRHECRGLPRSRMSPVIDTARMKIGEWLVHYDIITKDDADKIVAYSHRNGKKFGEALVELNVVSPSEAIGLFAAFFRSRYLPELRPEMIDRNLAQGERVGMDVCREYNILPLSKNFNDLVREPRVLEKMKQCLSSERGMRFVVSPQPAFPGLFEIVRQHFGDDFEVVYVSEMEFGSCLSETFFDTYETIERYEEAVEIGDNFAAGFFRTILASALERRSTDIRIVPISRNNGIVVSIQLPTGKQYELMRMPNMPEDKYREIISHLKGRASLAQEPSPIPLSGSWRENISGSRTNRIVPIRLQTNPSIHGETVSLRLLAGQVVSGDLESLGLSYTEATTIRMFMRSANGLILVTGPVGSGKTTLLYSMLELINRRERNVFSIEDPVEREMPGVIQVQIDEARGMTFDAALRSFLRSNSDVILVGEIRDIPTAQTAIQAALTGHLVLATLHVNSAFDVAQRLTHYGVEPWQVASVLRLAVGMRLVPTLCQKCLVPYDPSIETKLRLQLPDLPHGAQWWNSSGCRECINPPHYGPRTAICEAIPFGEMLGWDRYIGIPGGEAEIKRFFLDSGGARSIYLCALEKMLAGIISPEDLPIWPDGVDGSYAKSAAQTYWARIFEEKRPLGEEVGE